jgi:hypothetical protein
VADDLDAVPTLWLPDAGSDDVHAAFRARWNADSAGVVEVRALAASRFRLWVDGELVGDGPVRFPAEHPRCQRWQLPLPAGIHALAVHVHAFGCETRMLADLPGFVWAQVLDAHGQPAALAWRCRRLHEYRQTGRRVSPLFGPLEWAEPLEQWTGRAVDDRAWSVPAAATVQLGSFDVLPVETPLQTTIRPTQVATGTFADRFTGYEFDDPAMQFAVAQLDEPARPGTGGELPADGVWARYDLGRTRLGTAQVTVESGAGATVVVGGADQLWDGRVVPVVPLSTGPTAFVSRFRVPPGRHTVEPLSPTGLRYLEIRVYGDQPTISGLTFRSHERLDEPAGALRTGDDQLDHIWRVGLDTLRACADDVLVDTPTRERGQWLGDVSTCGLELESVAYGRASLARRSLLMAAECVDADGLVPGLFPGNRVRVSTFATQWVGACLHYVELTGDRALLERVWPAAESTLIYLTDRIGNDGDTCALPWAFVDWGYHPAGIDLATILLIRQGVADHLRAGELIDRADSGRWHEQLERLTRLCRDRWDEAGFHATAVAVRDGVFPRCTDEAADRLQAHLERCFPYHRSGSRQRDPATTSSRLATPYFANVSLAALLRAGRTDFVLEQYRRCWGWLLDQGATTWWEVFDSRWSRCHLWSAGPTWQLTRHLLGWQPRFDLGPGHVRLRPVGGAADLSRIDATIALPDGRPVRIRLERDNDTAAYRIDTAAPLMLHLPGGQTRAISPDRPQTVTMMLS